MTTVKPGECPAAYGHAEVSEQPVDEPDKHDRKAGPLGGDSAEDHPGRPVRAASKGRLTTPAHCPDMGLNHRSTSQHYPADQAAAARMETANSREHTHLKGHLSPCADREKVPSGPGIGHLRTRLADQDNGPGALVIDDN